MKTYRVQHNLVYNVLVISQFAWCDKVIGKRGQMEGQRSYFWFEEFYFTC